MLVEDDPLSREGYAEFLEGGGFRVAQCDTAEDAYSRSLELVPDVVVTDISLPGRDGFSLAADLRLLTRTRGIPVVAMTAYWAADVHERADRAGMTAILMKPCQPDHLIAELHRVLRSTQQTPLPHATRKPEVQASFLGSLPDSGPDFGLSPRIRSRGAGCWPHRASSPSPAPYSSRWVRCPSASAGT